MRAPELIRGLSVPCPFWGNVPPFRPPVLPAIREGGPPLPLLPHRRPERGFPRAPAAKRARFGAASAIFRPFRITLYKRQPGAPGIKVGSCTAGEVRDVCIYNA